MQFEAEEKSESGWANFNIEHGSGYAPERGEAGWWNVKVADAPSEIAHDIGLPHSWHVSTFLIFVWDEAALPEPPDTGDGPDEPENPEQPGSEKHVVRVELHYSDGSVSILQVE